MNSPRAVCIAGKNRIAIDVLRRVRATVPAGTTLFAVANRTDDGRDGWQPSFRRYADAQPDVTLVSLEAVYGIEDLLFLSVEFDRLIDPARFATTRLFNIHFSMLPAYKGMYTSCHPILNGDDATGCTLHRIDRGIDTGAIVDQRTIAIDDDLRCSELYLRYLEVGTDLISSNLQALLAGSETSRSQPAKGSTYYSKASIDYAALVIDLNQTAFCIQRQVNAFHHRAYQLPQIFGEAISRIVIDRRSSTVRPGTIVERSDDEIRFSSIDYDCVAVIDRFDTLRKAIADGDAQRCRVLLDAQPNLLSEYSREGWTPLILAAYAGQAEIVSALLDAGADPNRTNPKGTTPLMYAKDAYLRTGDADPFRRLLGAGADPFAQDIYDKTLADYAPDAARRLLA